MAGKWKSGHLAPKAAVTGSQETADAEREAASTQGCGVVTGTGRGAVPCPGLAGGGAAAWARGRAEALTL